ncbi:MAG: C2 family cysteine protease [Vicinamibacterales bacterium]
MPVNPERVSVTPDSRISIGKRAGKGTQGTLVRATSPQAIFEVRPMSDALQNAGAELNQKGRAVPLGDRGMLFPLTTRFYTASWVAGTFQKGEVATLAGDWLEPPDPATEFVPMFAIERITGSPGPVGGTPSFRAPFGVGAVDTGDVEVLTDETRLGGHTFRQEAGDLFPTPPAIEDIKQGTLADCGLLAALGSIMRLDPDFPRRIMKGHHAQVTVQLYDIELTPNGKTFHPRFITIDRSSVVDAQGDEAFAHGALWVKMIEKAYVAAGYLATTKVRSQRTSYASLESMNLDVAFGHLLGRAAAMTELNALDAPGQPYEGQPYPRRPISPHYEDAETSAFQQIQHALQAGRSVVVETRDEITKKRNTGSGHSGGEQVAKGLVGGHAYTVLDCQDLPDGKRVVQIRNPWGSYGTTAQQPAAAGKPVANERYGQQPPQHQPTFWLDARDLLRRFAKITVAD